MIIHTTLASALSVAVFAAAALAPAAAAAQWKPTKPVTIIVPLAVFFSLQRYFVRGLLAGSVKGG